MSREAHFFESASMMEENWVERDTANALRANASKFAHVIVLNDQGGGIMSVTEEKTATLRAQEHGHQPIICFAWANSSEAGISADETAPTIKATRSGEPAVCIEAAGFKGNMGAKAGNIGFTRGGVPDIGSRTGNARCLLSSGERD